MATRRKRKSGTWEFIIKNSKYLSKPIYLTFDTEEEGVDYCKKLELLIGRGWVPEEYRYTHKVTLIRDLIREYCSTAEMTESDIRNLNVCVERIGATSLTKMDIEWSEQWVAEMKQTLNLAPSTIRHHVGALARCLDWGISRKITCFDINPLRMLGKRYSIYGKRDIAVIEAVPGLIYKSNTQRIRRFNPGEEDLIRKTLDRIVINKGDGILRLPYQTSLVFLFDMALETAMRMREMFTLELDQIDLEQRTIHLRKSKNGDSREVPMSSIIMAKFISYVNQVKGNDPSMNGFSFDDGMVFPWLKGSKELKDMERVTINLSKQYARIFDKAGCNDFHFHDLRHEATSRFFEKTTLDSVEIAKITGHKDPRMLMIYANLRGSNLAKKLW